jgi:murein DD-endopeptidase MepM/ murein hydrolase activator NlpD
VYVRILRSRYRRSGLGSANLTSPISGDPTISSLFGPRAQPVPGASTNHQGIDYAVPIGTPVLSAGDGTVIFAGVQSGFGNTVEVDNGGGVVTLYGHLSSIGVSVGQTVGDGDQIALSGNTGTTSGPNLHFQVMVNGVAVDPTTQLAPVDTDVGLDTTSSVSVTFPELSTDSTGGGSDLDSDLSSDDSTLTENLDSVFSFLSPSSTASTSSTTSISPVAIAAAALVAFLALNSAVGS